MNELRPGMAVNEAARALRRALEPIGAAHEARWLLLSALGCTDAGLLLSGAQPLTQAQAQTLGAQLQRRLAGEPLQYVLGEWEFAGCPLFVGPGALIPRADTEILLERALALCKAEGFASALDLCTGSGALAVALAVHGGLKTVAAADISPQALFWARKNAARSRSAIEFYEGDLFAPVPGRFDLIVSNPPYIPTGDLAGLDREVREHEPRLALDGGADGLAFYRRIAAEAGGHLTPGGALLLEVGVGEAGAVQALLRGAGFANIRCTKDLAGIPRVVEGRAPARGAQGA